jgi:hypothetical protein
MKRKYCVLFVFLFVLSFFASEQVLFAQSPVAIWIHVSDDALPTDTTTMWFGNHKDATYEKLDTMTFPDLGFIREGYPDVPELWSYIGFDCVWYNIPGRANTWDQGLVIYDFRPFPTNEARKDTFRIKFYGDSSNSDITFRWPKAEYLANVCDSMKCYYYLHPLVNMFDVDSLVIPDAGDSNIIYLTIYKWGKLSVGIKPENPAVPDEFGLYFNYPNPFNPSTTIYYNVKENSYVDISIYDMLGRKVISLVAENHSPGTSYSVVWDGLNNDGLEVASGIYFARMTVQSNNRWEYIDTKKLLLVR